MGNTIVTTVAVNGYIAKSFALTSLYSDLGGAPSMQISAKNNVAGKKDRTAQVRMRSKGELDTVEPLAVHPAELLNYFKNSFALLPNRLQNAA